MEPKINSRIVLDFVRCFCSWSMYTVYGFFFELSGYLNALLDRVMFGNDQSYETSARSGCVMWKMKRSVVNIASPKDFLCMFLSCVHPDYVLKPNVSLYSLTEQEAIFVETAENINIYNSEESPFFYMAQFNRCKNVIKMPIQSFHKLAALIGNPSVPVIWLSNTGRCGSTILCQVFESVPGTLLIAENDAPLNIVYLLKSNIISETDSANMLVSTVRLLCKPHPRTERIFIKTRAFGMPLMADLSGLLPEIKQMFMYRNCMDNVSSFLAILLTGPLLLVTRVIADSERLSNLLPLFRKGLHYYIIFKLKTSAEIPWNVNVIGLLTHMWSNYILMARDAMSRDKKIIPIKYEDILAEPFRTCESIFARIGMDQKYLNAAVAAFNKDSQRGSVLSRQLVRNDPRRRIPTADRVKADVILSSYNLPKMDENFTIS